jgi:uncharacterized membrane protein YadS
MFKTEREQVEREIAANGGKAMTARQPLVPWFLWVFVILVAINSLGFVPAEVGKGLSDVSRLCLVVAIAALGIKTSFQQLAESGLAALHLALVETVWMATFVLVALFARQHGLSDRPYPTPRGRVLRSEARAFFVEGITPP